MKSDLKVAIVITIISLSFIFINISLINNINTTTYNQKSSTIMIISISDEYITVSKIVGTDQTPNIIHTLTAKIRLNPITHNNVVSYETANYREVETLFTYITYHWDTYDGISSDGSYAYSRDGWRWVQKQIIFPDIIKDYHLVIKIYSNTIAVVSITVTDIAP